MLTPIAENIWSIQHQFLVSSVPISSRMTIIKLGNGDVWLHSPVKLTAEHKAAIDAIGTVKTIVAPNRVHHLFAGEAAAMFPEATLYGPPGLAKKRPDLTTLNLLPEEPGLWQPELEYHLIQGIPYANETAWFHRPTKTLILTDICQWWRGNIGWKAALWGHITGVRNKFDVPRTVRRLVTDKTKIKTSAEKVLAWPTQRIIIAHNTVIEDNAHAQLRRAFRHFI